MKPIPLLLSSLFVAGVALGFCQKPQPQLDFPQTPDKTQTPPTGLLPKLDFPPQGPANTAEGNDLPSMGGITGNVATGDHAISGAFVILRALKSSVKGFPAVFGSRTDADGQYAFFKIPAGSYRLTVWARGVHQLEPGIAIETSPNQTHRQPTIRMAAGSAGEKAVIRARVLQLRVYFATDREPMHGPGPPDYFANNASSASHLSFGYCDFTIPDFDPAMSDAAAQAVRNQFGADAQLYPTVQKSETESLRDFQRDLSSQAHGQNALLYIHGYNNSFEEAAETAASLKVALKFLGPVVFFSWPSANRVSAYLTDEQRIGNTISSRHLSAVFQTIQQAGGIGKIHVLAHSMGSRALDAQWHSGRDLGGLGQIVYAAPDVATTDFKRELSTPPAGPDQINLYASLVDQALEASVIVHLWPELRAGQQVRGLTIPFLDTVDATPVDMTLLGFGHSYFINSPEVEDDIGGVLNQTPPSQRGPKLTRNPQGINDWRLSP